MFKAYMSPKLVFYVTFYAEINRRIKSNYKAKFANQQNPDVELGGYWLAQCCVGELNPNNLTFIFCNWLELSVSLGCG